MPAGDFLFDASTGCSKTYDELIACINSESVYYESGQFQNFYDFLVNFLRALVNDRNIILIDKDFSEEELKKLGYSEKIGNKLVIDKNPYIVADKDILIDKILNSKSLITFFTSGTTDIPKKIVHTLTALTRMVRRGDKYNDNVWAIAYNPTHMAGIQVILQALSNGNKMVYIFEASADEMKKSFFDKKISHLSATPTFYRLLLSDNSIFPFIKRITLGGEKSDNKLYKSITAGFPNAKINNIYASTELGSLFVSKNENFEVPSSLSDKVKVIETELLVHASLLSSKIDEEWYKTGDLVDVVTEFPLTFKFKNRKNEMINVGGYKVNPGEVEEAIRDFPEVHEAKVYGKPNSVLGNILCADIVLNSQNKIEISEIFTRLRILLQEYKIPRVIKFLNKIEVTRTGKLSRK